MTDNFMNYLEERLHQWAEWCNRGHGLGLGYPSCSNEYRLMQGEGIVIRGGLPNTGYTNSGAEEIEELVKQMAQFNFVMAEALRRYYLNSGSLRSKCKQLNMSHTHFKYCVDMAHHWLAGRLSRFQHVK